MLKCIEDIICGVFYVIMMCHLYISESIIQFIYKDSVPHCHAIDRPEQTNTSRHMMFTIYHNSPTILQISVFVSVLKIDNDCGRIGT